MSLQPASAAQEFRWAAFQLAQGLKRVACERIPAAFSSVSAEAKAIQDEELRRLRALGQPEEFRGDHEESAQMAGRLYEDAMNTAQQMMLNGCAVMLYHAFEQHLVRFLRRELLDLNEKTDPRLFCVREAYSRLSQYGVDCSRFPSWQILDELRLGANVVKHAQGRASEELRRLRPDLFRDRDIGEAFGFGRSEPEGTVYETLEGLDFVLTVHDLERYFDAVCAFWDCLATELERLATHH